MFSVLYLGSAILHSKKGGKIIIFYCKKFCFVQSKDSIKRWIYRPQKSSDYFFGSLKLNEYYITRIVDLEE